MSEQQEATDQQELENAEHDEHLYATIRGALESADSAACAVQTVLDALRDLHVKCLWYASGSDDECGSVDALAKDAWTALGTLVDGYRHTTAEYASEELEAVAS